MFCIVTFRGYTTLHKLLCIFYDGEVIEKGETADMFINPQAELTQKYLRGVF